MGTDRDDSRTNHHRMFEAIEKRLSPGDGSGQKRIQKFGRIIMEIEIEKNDAFRVLQTITRDSIVDVEHHIISRMKYHGLMSGDIEDCGNSLDDIAGFNGITMKQLIGLIFTAVEHTDEIPELAKSIVFIATGSDHPCPECGCELIIEPDGDWTNVECSNCMFRDTTEPDWDIQPGGHSFDN